MRWMDVDVNVDMDGSGLRVHVVTCPVHRRGRRDSESRGSLHKISKALYWNSCWRDAKWLMQVIGDSSRHNKCLNVVAFARRGMKRCRLARSHSPLL